MERLGKAFRVPYAHKTVKKRAPTRTSDFGVSRRESHDSSGFYGRKICEGPQVAGNAGIENVLPEKYADRIFCKSSEDMGELPDASVHLVVTSPPYNVGKAYDMDMTVGQYRALLRRVFGEMSRVLVDGGRACVNIANVGRKPYIPLHSFLIEDLTAAGFSMRGEVIWNKGSSAGASTAWGSWQSASNPTLRDTHEYILVFSKGSYRREKMDGRTSTISKDEFLEFTKSVWGFPSESAKKVGHPAPFPVELPYRLIQLYTFSNEIVLDPFMGSGQCFYAWASYGKGLLWVNWSPQIYHTRPSPRIEK